MSQVGFSETAHFSDFPRQKKAALLDWADKNRSIQKVYVFGSWAKGMAKPNSDLDLALVLDEGRDGALCEFILHRSAWNAELSNALGLTVKDIELADEPGTIAFRAVREHGILVYQRDA
jgi:predicted nucleotidyltransferase